MKDKGVNFEDYDLAGFKSENAIVTTDHRRAAWFRDTEGNLLGIRHLLDEQPAR